MFKLISKNSKYNFLGMKKIALLFSSFLIIVSLLSFASKGLNWGIDFSSGYIIQLKFNDDIEIKDVRDKFIENGVEDSVIQYFGSNKEVIIKLKEDTEFNKKSVNEFLIKSLKSDNNFQILKLEFVGSQIGSELRDKGEWAMLIALFSILLYIGLRFEFLYGIRRDIQSELLSSGYNVRLYVPFGQQWLPYTLRRLKEFKNLKFVFLNVFREFFSKKP